MDAPPASYYQADGLGSVTSLTNAAGTATQNYTYDSFGNIIATTGSLVNSFRYTGREFDTETSLYYYRARYYDPGTGRFLAEDPVRFSGGTNFYIYVTENPVNFVDQFGLCPPTRNQRLALAAKGLLNIGIGIGKTAGGIGLTAGSGGVGLAVGGYLIVSGIVANIGGGIIQIAGAATGDIKGGEEGADAAAVTGSAFGILTWAGTGGNICKAATAAKYEAVGLAPFTAGLGVESSVVDTAAGAADTALNGGEIVTGSGPCGPPPPPKPTSCSQGCPQ
jgi:RHS repeat-associated protein